MTFESIISIIKKIIDIGLVWILMYYVLKNVRNNVKLSLLFKGVAIVIVLKVVSDYIGLNTVGLLFEYVIMWGPLGLIIVFQPEIRDILEQLGRTQLLGRHKVLSVNEREKLVYELTSSLETLRKEKTGALIVIERDISLSEYINKAKKIYADISSELLISIFNTESPLHDGGVIIQGDRITCARAVFPTSNSSKINKRLGTRHRAAVGVTENTDAISLIVSEETGRLSISVKGELFHNLSVDDIRIMLIDELKPQLQEFDEMEDDIYEDME